MLGKAPWAFITCKIGPINCQSIGAHSHWACLPFAARVKVSNASHKSQISSIGVWILDESWEAFGGFAFSPPNPDRKLERTFRILERISNLHKIIGALLNVTFRLLWRSGETHRYQGEMARNSSRLLPFRQSLR